MDDIRTKADSDDHLKDNQLLAGTIAIQLLPTAGLLSGNVHENNQDSNTLSAV